MWAAIDESSWTGALDLLARLTERNFAAEARCHEELGDFATAADRWEAAGSTAATVRCARNIPDIERATRLAADTHPDLATRLRWLSELIQKAKDGEPLAGIELTPAERELVWRGMSKAVGAPTVPVASPRATK